MPHHPWFKFYPSDWRADQMLRLCSPAARGLWLECMCLMHEAKPYGHLLVNGRAVTEAQLSVLAGVPPDQTGALLAELDAAGVFSRNEDGVIFSRRMTRDADKAAAGAAHGKRGGNPALRAGRVNPDVKGTLKGEGSPRSQSPEPESDSRILNTVVRSLRGETPWTSEQKQAAWQSKICAEAARIMTDEDYARFLADWAAGEPSARKTAERIDATLKAAKARIPVV